MRLLENERITEKVAGGTVTLTNFRIRYRTDTDITSLLLENIRSVSIKSFHYPFLAIAGIMLLGASVIAIQEVKGLAILGIFVALACIGAYFYTRTKHLTIASSSDQMRIITKGQSMDKVAAFADTLEEHILQRKQELLATVMSGNRAS